MRQRRTRAVDHDDTIGANPAQDVRGGRKALLRELVEGHNGRPPAGRVLALVRSLIELRVDEVADAARRGGAGEGVTDVGRQRFASRSSSDRDPTTIGCRGNGE